VSDTRLKGIASFAPFFLTLSGIFMSLLGYGTGTGEVPPLRGLFASIAASITSSQLSEASIVLSSTVVLGLGIGVTISGVLSFRIPAARRLSKASLSSSLPSLSDVLTDKIASAIAPDMNAAGFVANPIVYVGRYVSFGVRSGVVTLPLSVALSYALGSPVFFGMDLIPLVAFLVPWMEVTNMKHSTLKGVEDELPYFALFAAVLQSAGVSLYESFGRATGGGVLRWMRLEGSMVTKEREFFGKTESEAMLERARGGPSERLSTYISGYASVLASGGDVASYLEDKVKQYLNWIEFRWKKYASSASDIGEALISMYFVLPLLILSVAFVYPDAVMDVVALVVIFALPMLSVASYLVVDMAQPKGHDPVKGNAMYGLIGGGVASAVAYALQGPFWLVFAAGAGVSSGVYGFSTYRQVREVKQCENALPEFLRDLTEYKKIGYDLTRAFTKLAHERKYTPAFDAFLQDATRQIELGSRLKEVVVKARSWMVKMMFQTLAEMVESGGGTPQLMEMLTEFNQRIQTVKKETKSQMRLYEILTFATPVGLAFMILLMQFMMSSFGSVSSTLGSSAGILSSFSQTSPAFLDLTKVLILEAAVAAAVLGSKAVDFTTRTTFRMTAVVGITAVVLLLSESVLVPLVSLA